MKLHKALLLFLVALHASASSAHAATLACFDANGQGGPTNTGFTAITSTTVNVQNGVNLAISSLGNASNRNRGGDDAPIDGRPDEAMLQDFFFVPGTLTLTLTGLAANQSYDVTIYTYDAEFNTGASSWYQDSIDPGNLLGSITVNTSNPDLSQLTTSLTSSATGEIVIVGEDLPGSANGIKFNGIEVAAIPEPSSAFIGSFGLLALLIRRRRS